MREIKFRGRRLDNGEWVHGSLLLLNDQAEIVNHEEAPLVDPSTVGQYIGMKDCKDTEIYEGDIVRWEECVGDAAYRKFDTAIYYHHGEFRPVNNFFNIGYADDDCEISILDCEVIGNIHDYPELLKGGDE